MYKTKMENKSSLDHTLDQDYSEFLNEYLLQNITQCQESEVNYDGVYWNLMKNKK